MEFTIVKVLNGLGSKTCSDITYTMAVRLPRSTPLSRVCHLCKFMWILTYLHKSHWGGFGMFAWYHSRSLISSQKSSYPWWPVVLKHLIDIVDNTFLQWAEESKCDILRYIHLELYYQTLSTVQSTYAWTHFGRHCNISSFLSFWVLACCRALQGTVYIICQHWGATENSVVAPLLCRSILQFSQRFFNPRSSPTLLLPGSHCCYQWCAWRICSGCRRPQPLPFMWYCLCIGFDACL